MSNPLDYTITSLNKLLPKKGRLLLAEPFMDDPYFKRAVVLLTEYNKEGALGFILNKPLALTINETIPDFPKFDATVYIGGPVQSDRVFYIHNQGEFIEGSIEISDDLYWSGNFNRLKKLIEDQQIFPHEIQFFLGYSGWDYEQLTQEIKEEDWIISDLKMSFKHDLNNPKLWEILLKKIGKRSIPS